jgi:hypothetical protein
MRLHGLPAIIAAVALPALMARPAAGQDPVRVTAELSVREVQVGQPTTLRITVETRGEAPDEILEPRLSRDLEIVGTSEFTQSQLSVPGGRSRVTRRELTLVARRTGVFRIAPVVVRVGGRHYESAALDLVVGDGGRGGTAGTGSPRGRAPGTTTLRLRLQPDTVFVGQQVLVHAEATFGEDARSRQSRPPSFEPPAPPGFWVQDVPSPVAVQLSVQQGRSVETQTFRRAIFPLDAGTHTIPPARLYYEVRRGLLLTPETREVVSDSVQLVVLPLPDARRPAGFSGAVGRLQLHATAEPATIAAGETVVVTVELAGTGNVRMLPDPGFPELAGVAVFPSTHEARVDVAGGVVGGVKRFRWSLVPGDTGVLVIPPIEYSVFDPELRQYVALSSEPLRVEVIGARAAGADGDLMPLRQRTGDEPLAWARTRWFGAAQAVPVLLLAIAGFVRRRRDAPPGPRQHHRRISGELALLARRSDPNRMRDLDRLLREAVQALAGAPADGDPVAWLRDAGRPAAAYDLNSVLVEAQRLRYDAGRDTAAEAAVIERARAFIDSIAPGRRRRWAAAVAALVAGGAMAAGVAGLSGVMTAASEPAVAQSVPSLPPTPPASSRPAPPTLTEQESSRQAFAAAAARLEASDAAGAANLYLAYARARPRDPNGWYNAGNAAWLAGDRGAAVWAWLRALRIAPRDPELLHNLGAAGATDAAALVRPPDRLAAGERMLLAAAAWWLLVLAFALRHRLRVMLLAGGAAVVLLVAAAGTTAWQATRPPLVTPLRAGAPLFAGPSIHDEQTGHLPVGAVARVQARREGWVRVRYAGREAWVERPAVAAP